MTTELERQLASLKQGDHVCPIYESVAEQLAVAIPFISQGLARGERCVYVADQRSSEQLAQALAETGVDIASESARGALRFLTKHETFLVEGKFEPREMIDLFGLEQTRAVENGFSGLRVSGDMSWVLGSEVTPEKLVEFEALLNKFCGSCRCVVVCHYDRTRFPAAVIQEVLRTHPVVILGEQVCPNPYYEPPEFILSTMTTASPEFTAKRVDWWIHQLKRARSAAQEREQVLRQLDTERARFEAVLRQMPAGVAIVKAPSGNAILGNEQLQRIFGETVRGLRNLRDYKRFPVFYPDGRPYPFEEWPAVRAITTGEEVLDEELVIVRGDGASRTLRVSSTPIRDRAARVIAAVVTVFDATEQRRSRAASKRHTDQLQGLAEASVTIQSRESPAAVAQEVTEAARQIVGAHLAGTSFLIDVDWAQAIQAVSLSEKYATLRGSNVLPDSSDIYAVVCETNRPLRLTQSELEAHPRWRGIAKEAGRQPPLRGLLAAPLMARDGHNVGLVALSDKYEGEFTPDDEAILIQLTQMASVAIENAWLYEREKAGRERLQTLSRQLLEVQESERRHLARELHDEVGQLLTGLRLLLSPNAETAQSRVEQAQAVADELLEKVRGLSFDLRPAALDELGLVPALLALFERYRDETGVLVNFKHQGVDRRFTPEVETTAYRIVQEALTNVARYAGAAGVNVRLWTVQGVLNLQVEDRGRGFDAEAVLAARQSSGLAGMRERATGVGGRLTIESSPGAGTQVMAELPFRQGGQETKK